MSLEAQLADVFREVLAADHVEPDDHFFRRGGHSLAAMQAVPIDHVPVELAVPLYIARDRASDVAEVAIPHQPRKSLSRKRGIFSLTSRALGTLRGLFLFWIERPRLPMIPLLIQRRAAP